MISVIIPAFNEAKFIKKTIEELRLHSANSKELEIIVVNNASSDNTSDVVATFAEVILINLEKSITVGQARNIGVGFSHGDVLAFIDADILVTQQWWDALVEFAEKKDHGDSVITGNKVFVSQNPSWVENSWFSCSKKTTSTYINSGNLICARRVFDVVGGFDSTLKTGEDVDFCHRAKKLGAVISPDEVFFVYHEGYPKTISAFFKREKWHGIGDVQSVTKFFRSKIALISFAMAAFACCFLIFGLFGFYKLSAVFLFLILTINLLTLVMRIKIVSLHQFLMAFFLNYVYFSARFLSIFSVLGKGVRSR